MILGILGYSEDGRRYIQEMRAKGIEVIVGLRDFWDEYGAAVTDGIDIFTPEDVAARADVIQVW